MPARQRAVIFIVAALGYVLSQFYRSMLTVIVDDLTRDLGIGAVEYGALGSAWFLAFSLSQFPVGWALDRFGPRRTMAGTLLFAVIGAVLFALARTSGAGIAAMALIGIGCSPLLMGALYFLARTEEPKRFATLASLFLGFGLLGSLASATPLALVAAWLGWRRAVLLVAATTALAAIMLFAVMRDPPREEAPHGGSFLGDLVALVRAPGMWPILVMSFAVSSPVFAERALWIGPFFGDVHGFDAIARGNATLMLAVAMTVSAVIAGPVSEWVGSPKRVVVVANAVSGGLLIILGLWREAPAPAALALIAGAGLFGVTYAVMVGHARLFMPTHVIGRGITFVNFISIGSTGLIQLASGYAVDAMIRAGLAPPVIFGNLHLAFGAFIILAVAVYLLAAERPR